MDADLCAEDCTMAQDPSGWDSPRPSPGVLKFGDEPLITEGNDPKQVKLLLEQGCVITPSAILAACYQSESDTLSLLLDHDSPGPNARPEAKLMGASLACKDLPSSDVALLLRRKDSQYYPLHFASIGMRSEFKEGHRATMNVLLRYKPDLFAEFLQPLWYDADDRPGAYMSDVGELVCVESDSDDEWYELSSDGEMPKIETKYAARSLFHVMLEDGALVEPILNCDGLDFDVNRRDPQGRTLMHSVCRNALGADVHADVESYEIREPIDGRFIANEGTGPSLFEIFHRRGGDLQARDYRGKNVLHHLLEARSLRYERAQPPFIYNTFKYILQHLPELVNSPDNHGTYPLHAALNRVREITFPTVWQKFSPIEQLVKDLLDAGARPLEIDSRGNTALHYLADSGLGERTDREPRRALFRFFCEAGVDVNARNHKGRTAIELFLDNHKVHEATLDVSMYLKDDNGGPRVQIEDDLLELFEASGARWTDVDPKGQTLLHWVARHNPWYARSRAYYLLKRGVDPRAKDKKGRTAQDVAEAAGNNTVAAVLRGWLVRTAKSQMADQA